MTLEKEKVKLDEVLKFLFSTSNKVLVKLLNGIFDENFDVDEVELAVSNNEFVEDDLGILRGDIFFDLINRDYNKVSYHIEFQTKNDSTMVIRMFEYGFKKGKEQSRLEKDSCQDIRTIYFPKQKVIFFEENKKIQDTLALKIIFPNEQEVVYTVEVMKYWKYTDEELREKQMYPLIPLQLFNLRKEIEKAQQKQDMDQMNTMTKTLYDPEVERRGIEKGIEKGIEQGKKEAARALLDLLDDETIAVRMGLSIEEVKSLRK